MMIKPTESRTAERQESIVTTERTAAGPDSLSAPASLDHGEQTEQVSQSGAGVEQHERVVTDATGLQHSVRTVRDVAAEKRMNLHTISQVIMLLFGIVEGLIGLRIILRLIGANPENDFARFIYNGAGLFLAPFFGLVGSPASGGMVLEIPSLVGMLFYALLAWLSVAVIWPLFERQTTRSTSTYDRFDS